MRKIAQDISRYASKVVVYLPEVGLVYRNNRDIVNLVQDILDNARSDQYLKYDKNQVWFKKKPEKILKDKIILSSEYLAIPAIDSLRKILKVYTFFDQDVDLSKIRNKLPIPTKKADWEKVIIFSNNAQSFKKPKVYNIFVREFTKSFISKENQNKEICSIDRLTKEQCDTFLSSCNEPQLVSNIFRKQGIAWVENEKVLGILGPINYFFDPWNTKQLLAPYTEVLNMHRKRGIARKLWQHLSRLAIKNGAEYTIFQTPVNSSADHFYSKNGFKNLGHIYSKIINKA